MGVLSDEHIFISHADLLVNAIHATWDFLGEEHATPVLTQEEHATYFADHCIFVQLGIGGDHVELTFPYTFIIDALRNELGIRYVPLNDPRAVDWAGEVTNIFAGLLAVEFDKFGYDFEIGLPDVKWTRGSNKKETQRALVTYTFQVGSNVIRLKGLRGSVGTVSSTSQTRF